MKQPKWKSPVAWAAGASVVFMVVKSWFGFEIPNFDAIITGVIGALVLFGVLNSPDKKDKF